MKKNFIRKSIITLMTVFVLSICSAAFSINVEAASKPVSKVYCCLYKSGKLVISQKKIKPKKGAKVLENKKLAAPGRLKNIKKVKVAYIKGKVKPKSCYRWFWFCTNMKKVVNLKNLDTSQCTDMYQMFACCESLKKVDVSGFKTSKVWSIGAMFAGCKSLEKINIKNFDMRSVDDGAYIFEDCKKLKRIDFGILNPKKNGSLQGIVNRCSSLETVTIKNLKAPKDISYMFNDCKALKKVVFTKVDTSKTTNMSGMFRNCKSLKRIDLSKFNTSKVTDMSSMFEKCKAIETLNIRNFFISNKCKKSDVFLNFSKTGTVIINQKAKDMICSRAGTGYRYVNSWKIVDAA